MGDFQNALSYQQAMMNNLSANNTLLSYANGTTVNPTLMNNVTNVLTAAGGLSTYAPSNNQQAVILAKQNDTSRILDREYARLVQKQTSVDNTLQMQRRFADLNSSATLRYAAYTNIVMMVALMAGVFLLSAYVKASVPAIPPIVMTIVMVIVFVIGIIVVLSNVNDINRRDNMDFNKLSQANMVASSALDASGTSINTNFSVTCVGNACCPSGMYYDTSYNTCKICDNPAYNPSNPSATDARGNVIPCTLASTAYKADTTSYGGTIGGTYRTGFTTIEQAYQQNEMMSSPPLDSRFTYGMVNAVDDQTSVSYAMYQ